MNPENITLVAAFTAGLFSFVSPCVLPLIPSYVSYISGISFGDLCREKNIEQTRKKIIINSVFFILGFSVVFIALGAAVTLLGQLFYEYQPIIRKAGAVFIIIMGLQISGVFHIRLLLMEKRVKQTFSKPAGHFGSFVVGIGFAAGWTPCIGPILASILIVAGTEESFTSGLLLLVIYSVGFAIPFLLTSIGINKFIKHFTRFTRYIRILSIVCGALLVILGVLIFTDYFAVFTVFLNSLFPDLVFN